VRAIAPLLMIVMAVVPVVPVQAQKRPLPYYASISASVARMRTGPGRNFPAIWLYQRADLPVKVIAIYKEWRKVADPDGTEGWLQANLLSERRSGIVTGGVAELRAEPRANADIAWHAEPGVVGRVSKCARGWCWFDVRGRAGYIEAARLWGVGADESFE